MKQYTINRNDAGQRLDKFILKAAPTLPKSLMYKSIRKKNIKLNGKRCEASQLLCEGDVLALYISDEFFPDEKVGKIFNFNGSTAKPDIVFEDEDIAVINKPVNLPCHSGGRTEDTLVDRFVRYLAGKGEYVPENEASFTPALCNRLDRNTCGLVIGAKNAAALRAVNELIRNGGAVKKYLCFTVHVPRDESALLTAYMRKNERTNTVEVSDVPREGFTETKTGYRVLERLENNLCLLEVTLYSGFTHQIRAQLAHIGCPVAGDRKYGDERFNRGFEHQALQSYELRLNFPEASAYSKYNKMIFRAPEKLKL